MGKTSSFFAAALFAGVMAVATTVLAADVDDDGVGDLCDHCPDTPDPRRRGPARLRGRSGADERPVE